MYPELNFAKSFSKLKELFGAYNKVVKDRHPEQYKKLSLKSTQIETMKEILRFYGAHLYKNKNRKLSPNRRFWITNTGIANSCQRVPPIPVLRVPVIPAGSVPV
jgi:hypothetical protein